MPLVLAKVSNVTAPAADPAKWRRVNAPERARVALDPANSPTVTAHVAKSNVDVSLIRFKMNVYGFGLCLCEMCSYLESL